MKDDLGPSGPVDASERPHVVGEDADRFSEFLNTNLKLLYLLHGRESDFKARSPLQRDARIAGP